MGWTQRDLDHITPKPSPLVTPELHIPLTIHTASLREKQNSGLEVRQLAFIYIQYLFI